MEQLKTKRSRDPIRDAPLRDPGQSLREQIDGYIDESVFPWIAVTVLAVIVAVVEWIRWWTGAKYQPLLLTIVAVAVAAIAAWKIVHARRLLTRWKLGLKGERAVGQYLQAALLPHGYVVIHDVCIDDFNVDHAIIGPGGVFAVEVKTHSKPVRGDVRITYDGAQVLVHGKKPDRDPVRQARAGAQRLGQIIEQYAGRAVPVRSVVLYPGWYVEVQPRAVETWVLNEKAFVKFVEHEPTQLTAEDCRVLSEALARYVRQHLEL